MGALLWLPLLLTLGFADTHTNSSEKVSEKVKVTRKCQAKGEHFVDLRVRISAQSLSEVSLNDVKKRAMERLQGNQKKLIEFQGKLLAKHHCTKMGYEYLHAYFWQRTEDGPSFSARQRSNPDWKSPYSVTQVICSNSEPSNKHGSGRIAEGNDHAARVTIAKHHIKTLKPHQIAPNSSTLRLAKQNRVCADLYTVASTTDSPTAGAASPAAAKGSASGTSR